MDWRAIELSLRLSTLTTFLLLILGLPLSSWLAFSRWRWKFFIEAVIALPIVLPQPLSRIFSNNSTRPRPTNAFPYRPAKIARRCSFTGSPTWFSGEIK